MKPVVRSLAKPEERTAAIPQLAALRMTVFRDWPYLYDGTAAYEADYLRAFANEPGSVLVVAKAGPDIVGAATASPMAGQSADIQGPVRAYGLDAGTLFYFGESVLLPAYRGIGIGHGFFDAREAAARDAGATATCFCAVVRPDDHPLKPKGARDLTPFWRSRGYAPVEGLTCRLDWRDIDQPDESPHLMQFWMRTL